MRALPSRLSPPVLVGLLLFGLTLAVYVSGLPPSLTWQNSAADGGDLAAAVETLGVPHPPGYPTYVLLGRVFRLLPFGDTAHRLGIMSAAAAAGAVAGTFGAGLLLARLIRPWRGGVASNGASAVSHPSVDFGLPEYIAAVAAALILASTPVFWSQAIVAEVYALNALFAVSIAALVFSWLHERRLRGLQSSPRKLALAALLFGLGLGNHLTVAAIGLPLLLVAGPRVARVYRPATLGLIAAAFLAGLAVYAYLPIAAAANPPIAWGDPTSPSRFWWLVSGEIYRGYVFGVDSSLFGSRLAAWANLMLQQFNGLGVVLGAVGAWWLARRDASVGWAFVLAFFAVSVYATLYISADSFVFLIPAIMIGALWVGLGLHFVAIELVLPRVSGAESSPRATRFLAALAIALLVLIPGVNVVRSYPERDGLHLNLRRDRGATDFASDVFQRAGPDGIVIASTDQAIFALWYQRYVVDKSSGVSVIARELLEFDWYAQKLLDHEPGLVPGGLPTGITAAESALVAAQIGRRPIFATFRDPALGDYDLRQEGVLWRVAGKRS